MIAQYYQFIHSSEDQILMTESQYWSSAPNLNEFRSLDDKIITYYVKFILQQKLTNFLKVSLMKYNYINQSTSNIKYPRKLHDIQYMRARISVCYLPCIHYPSCKSTLSEISPFGLNKIGNNTDQMTLQYTQIKTSFNNYQFIETHTHILCRSSNL